jgi:hypothetical protein
MNFNALPRKSTRISVIAVALFVALLALRPGYSEESSAAPDTVLANVAPASVNNSSRPFSKIAIGVTAGTLGVGAEIATPLSRHTNLRVDGYFFNYSQNFSQDGFSYNAILHLRDVRASYDYFPFRSGFRISGGVAMYNQFNVGAVANVPAGSTLTLNSVDYYSSTSDPLHGSASIAYAHKIAPTVTIGWGNAIPRGNHHLAFPVEIGAAFTGAPKFNLAMKGSACATPDPATCMPVNSSSDFQSNLTAERAKINNDIAPLRVYPILNVGVTYRF